MSVDKTPTLPDRNAPKKRRTQNPVRLLARLAVESALDKKASDVIVMDMRAVSGVADFFILCTGTSDLQIKAISDAVREHIRDEAGERPWHTEGYSGLQWVLLDYVDLVVHVFSEEKRHFYDLERLWGDAPREEISDDTSISDVKMLQD